jgi:hypothetical protein
MMVNNKKNLLLTLLFFINTPAICSNDYVNAWKRSYVDLMSLQEKQMLGNILYNLLSSSIAEWQIRQFATPIARLNQATRIKIDAYQNPTEDIAMLRTLLERLAYVVHTRTIYAQTLSTCITHYNENNPSQLIQNALAGLQLDAQTRLCVWADGQAEDMALLLQKSSDFINDSIQHFQGIARLHKGMGNGQMPVELPVGSDDNKSIVVLSIILKNNPELFAVTEGVINTLNETSDHAARIIQEGIAIYKDYYTVLYDALMSASCDKGYATTLFSMYGVLPDEYRTKLPDCDHVFEHMLQTVKLYTQTEFSQP